MSEEIKKVKEKEYTLVEVPTQMGLAFQTPEEKILTQEQLLVEIVNKVNKIEKALA